MIVHGGNRPWGYFDIGSHLKHLYTHRAIPSRLSLQFGRSPLCNLDHYILNVWKRCLGKYNFSIAMYFIYIALPRFCFERKREGETEGSKKGGGGRAELHITLSSWFRVRIMIKTWIQILLYIIRLIAYIISGNTPCPSTQHIAPISTYSLDFQRRRHFKGGNGQKGKFPNYIMHYVHDLYCKSCLSVGIRSYCMDYLTDSLIWFLRS